MLSITDACQIAMNSYTEGKIYSVKKVQNGYLIGFSNEVEWDYIEHVLFVDEVTGGIERANFYYSRYASERKIRLPINDWLTELNIKSIREIDCEDSRARKHYSDNEINQQKNLVRRKLVNAGSELEIEEFMELLTPDYRERIAKYKTFITITKFERSKVRRIFIEEALMNWREEMGAEIHSDGYVYARYYSYALCTENDSMELRRITLAIRYNGEQGSMGVFSCEGEDDIVIRYKDVFTMLETSLRPFWLPYARLEKEKVYKLVCEYVESKEPGKWMRRYDDLKPLFNALQKECLEWEIDDGKNITCVLPPNVVYIKKVKEENLTENTPEIYMLTSFCDWSFEPTLESFILIAYKGKYYTYKLPIIGWNNGRL